MSQNLAIGLCLLAGFLTTFLAVSVRWLTRDWGETISRVLAAVVLGLAFLIFFSHAAEETNEVLRLAYLTAFLLPLIPLYNFFVWRLLVFNGGSHELERRSFWVWFEDHKEFGAFRLAFFFLYVSLAWLLSEILGFAGGVGTVVMLVGIPIVLFVTSFRLALQEEREIAEEIGIKVSDLFPPLRGEDLPEALAEGLVLVQCHAAWCKPCPAMALTLKSVVGARRDIKVLSLDSQEEYELLMRYDVRALPTVMVFWSGELLGLIKGRSSRSALCDRLAKMTARLPLPALQ